MDFTYLLRGKTISRGRKDHQLTLIGSNFSKISCEPATAPSGFRISARKDTICASSDIRPADLWCQVVCGFSYHQAMHTELC